MKAAAIACCSIEVLCSCQMLCDVTLSDSAMTIPLKGFGWLGSKMMRLNPSLGRDSGVQSCPLPAGAPAIWRLREKAVRNVSPQIHRKVVSGQSCSPVAGGFFVACCCRRFWYSGCPNVHVALVIEHVRGFLVKKHWHVVGACLQSVPRSVSCGVSDTFWKNFASCHPLLVSTV